MFPPPRVTWANFSAGTQRVCRRNDRIKGATCHKSHQHSVAGIIAAMVVSAINKTFKLWLQLWFWAAFLLTLRLKSDCIKWLYLRLTFVIFILNKTHYPSFGNLLNSELCSRNRNGSRLSRWEIADCNCYWQSPLTIAISMWQMPIAISNGYFHLQLIGNFQWQLLLAIANRSC